VYFKRSAVKKRGFMFGGKIGLPELLVVFAIGLLIFGPSKLAGLGKSLGEGIRGFKSALSDEEKKP
jgi:sec-independent protein translocase protein TatA